MKPEIAETIQYDETHVDVEAIMRQIRQYLGRKPDSLVRGPDDLPADTLFDRQVYDELYEADQKYDKGYVSLYLTPSRAPFIGRAWLRLRAFFHTLVVFYVNRAVDAQSRFNLHVVRVLDGIIRGIDQDQTPERVAQLEQRIQELEQRVAALAQPPTAEPGRGEVQ